MNFESDSKVEEYEKREANVRSFVQSIQDATPPELSELAPSTVLGLMLYGDEIEAQLDAEGVPPYRDE